MALNTDKQPLTQRPFENLGQTALRLPPHTPRPQMVTTPPHLKTPEPPPPPKNDVAPPPASTSNVTRHPSSPPPPPPLAPYGDLTQTERAVRKAAALAAVTAGMRQIDAAEKFRVPQATISGWITRPNRVAPRSRPASPPSAPAAAETPEPASTRKGPGGPLARLDAIAEQLQASLEQTTLAIRELDDIRSAFRQLFGG